MIHLAKWSFNKGLFRELGKLFKKGEFLIFYGSFKICNKYKIESNYFFLKIHLRFKIIFGVLKILWKLLMRVRKIFFSPEDIKSLQINFQ